MISTSVAEKLLNLESTSTAGPKGSIYWMAPEVLQPPYSYSVKSDVYSFGIVLYEMTTRELPYPRLIRPQIMFGVASGNLRPDFHRVKKNTLAILQKILRILRISTAFDPTIRPTFIEIHSELRAQPLTLKSLSQPVYLSKHDENC